MRVTYFANDLSDPAVERRVRMLRIGGADVRLLGFRRSPEPVREIEGITAVDLGRTTAGRLVDRCFRVLAAVAKAGRWRRLISDSDVLLARNLEMVTIADAVRGRSRSDVRLAYECLDIHASLLGHGVGARLLRGWERRALRRSASLIVSSSGFLTNYFERLGVALPEVILAENKLVFPDARFTRPRPDPAGPRPPWKIGWFGNLRCVASFRLLMGVAQRHPKLIDVELRGRPTLEVERLIARHLPTQSMRFAGSYTSTDLVSIYGTRDFTWAIDYSQRGQNSEWLLPNRVYEGNFYNCPVIARAGTETGAWLKARGVGVLLDDPCVELDPFVTGLTPARYLVLQGLSAAVRTNHLAWTVEECREFAQRISNN